MEQPASMDSIVSKMQELFTARNVDVSKSAVEEVFKELVDSPEGCELLSTVVGGRAGAGGVEAEARGHQETSSRYPSRKRAPPPPQAPTQVTPSQPPPPSQPQAQLTITDLGADDQDIILRENGQYVVYRLKLPSKSELNALKTHLVKKGEEPKEAKNKGGAKKKNVKKKKTTTPPNNTSSQPGHQEEEDKDEAEQDEEDIDEAALLEPTIYQKAEMNDAAKWLRDVDDDSGAVDPGESAVEEMSHFVNFATVAVPCPAEGQDLLPTTNVPVAQVEEQNVDKVSGSASFRSAVEAGSWLTANRMAALLLMKGDCLADTFAIGGGGWVAYPL